MIKKIKLTNFKSFKDVTIDFTGANGVPKKSIFIYGENGSGKSNIVSSIAFLQYTIRSLLAVKEIEEFFNSKKKRFNMKEHAQLRTNFKCDIHQLISKCKLIGSDENMKLHYELVINDKTVEYDIEFDNEGIVYESLYYPILKNRTLVYEVKGIDNVFINDSLFKDKTYKNIILDTIKRYLGKHSVLAVFSNEYNNNNSDYMQRKMNNAILNIIDGINACGVLYKGSKGIEGHIRKDSLFDFNLTNGIIDIKNRNQFKKVEEIISDFFSSIYSDITGAFYKEYEDHDNKEDNIKEIHYNLYFKKMISNEIRDIPYYKESTGTLKILELLPFLYQSVSGGTVILDEIDSGIHDLLMLSLVKMMEEQINGQIIITTHNTMLLNEIKPDTVFVIQIDAKGDKEVVCIKDFGERIQKNHNLAHKYLQGLYGGIPQPSIFDMREYIDDKDKKE